MAIVQTDTGKKETYRVRSIQIALGSLVRTSSRQPSLDRMQHDMPNTSDAEAAFKKLTAAFETLHDPTKQAASRATAEYGQNKRRKGDRHKSSTAGNTGTRAAHNSGSQDRTGSEEGRGEKGNGPFGGGGAGSRGSGGGMGAGEAPRWCREGEYVPRKEREKDGEEDVPEDGKGAVR